MRLLLIIFLFAIEVSAQVAPFVVPATGGGGTVEYNAQGGAYGNWAQDPTASITVGSSAGRAGIVGIWYRYDQGTLDGVDWGATGMTSVGEVTLDAYQRIAVYKVVGISSGATTITTHFSTGLPSVIMAVSASGANQTDPVRDYATATAGWALSVNSTPASAVNDLMIDFIVFTQNRTYTPDGGQTGRVSVDYSGNAYGRASTKPGEATETIMGWSANDYDSMIHFAVSVKP